MYEQCNARSTNSCFSIFMVNTTYQNGFNVSKDSELFKCRPSGKEGKQSKQLGGVVPDSYRLDMIYDLDHEIWGWINKCFIKVYHVPVMVFSFLRGRHIIVCLLVCFHFACSNQFAFFLLPWDVRGKMQEEIRAKGDVRKALVGPSGFAVGGWLKAAYRTVGSLCDAGISSQFQCFVNKGQDSCSFPTIFTAQTAKLKRENTHTHTHSLMLTPTHNTRS